MSAHPLDRFVDAQDPVFDQALRELMAGRKRSHWMWFIFPQMRGLGLSHTSQHYGLSGRREAEDYLRHPVLGPRLVTCTSAVLCHPKLTPLEIFGAIDALKFRSSMTLFRAVAGDTTVFGQAMMSFYGGQDDTRTLDLLNA